MLQNFKQENNELANSLLRSTFLSSYKNHENENFTKFEIILTPVCDLACKYCYLVRYGNKLYPEEIRNREEIITNVSLLLDWLIDNEFTPEIELFSGDPLVQQIGYDVLDLIFNKFKVVPKEKRVPAVIIPTNYSFILSTELIQRVEELIVKFASIGIYLGLSASIDGVYLDKYNRPICHRKRGNLTSEYLLNGDNNARDDSFYTQVFEFNKKHRMGFHPMVYSNKIEYWKDNFLWFQAMFTKHDMPFNNIYLLEVRNQEWSSNQIRTFAEFISFLIEWSFAKCNANAEDFIDFLFRLRGYNILSSPLTTIGRGLGCSIQSTISVRAGDLKSFPCHRLMYPQFEQLHFEKDSAGKLFLVGTNPELLIGVVTFDANNLPICRSCLIKSLCSKGCLGSQFETTGDMFSPIPTVCALMHAKMYAMVTTFDRLGIKDLILDRITPEKAYAFNSLLLLDSR